MGNVTSNVAAKFAFFPPDPPTYEVTKGEDGMWVFTGINGDMNVDVHVLETKGGNKVVATFWKHPFARFTLLYSHGNAADLGQMQELFIELRAHLRVNVMSYDYSGYGASTGKPMEQNTYYDIEAVYECLKREYNVKQEDLILYGQSVGSGPTLHLASRLPGLRGVVLHSAILSGIRVLYPVKVTLWFDIYKILFNICRILTKFGMSAAQFLLCIEQSGKEGGGGFLQSMTFKPYLSKLWPSAETPSSTYNRVQMMRLSTFPMVDVYGNCQGRNTSHYGSKAVAIATSRHTQNTSSIYVNL